MDTLVERLQEFNTSRDPRLVQLKYHLMRADAFAFYRGTCHLFYQDWPRQTLLNEAPATWICGDLHWQNLGSYKGDNRLVYFGLNDFDEAVLAPCTWDLARLLVSISVSAPILKISAEQAQELCKYFVKIYAQELAAGRVRMIEEDKTNGLVRELLFQVRVRSRKAFLDSRTVEMPEGRKLRIDGQRASAASDAQRTSVTALVEQWGARQPHPEFFRVLDVAQRIAGVGSLGVERYVVLVAGKGLPDQNYLLDLKAEPDSSLQPYLIAPQPRWQDNAVRAVTIQHWVQGVPPAFLVPLQAGTNSYVLRELQPVEDKVNIALLGSKFGRTEKLVKAIAQVVAWGQLRSAGRQGAADAHELIQCAEAKMCSKVLLDYAQHYSRVVQQDYAAFCTAYDQGCFGPPLHAADQHTVTSI